MRRVASTGLAFVICALAGTASATPIGKSDLPGRRVVFGMKWPNSASEGTVPVRTYAEIATTATLGGYSSLVPYVIQSPDQEDAGSCLYMSLTGIAEWWLAKLYPSASRAHDGPIDLSERYMMNIAGGDEATSPVANWKTDSIDLYNKTGYAVLNSSYRFTKGWFMKDAEGNPKPVAANTEGAEFSAMYNWIDQSATVNAPTAYVALPHFEHEVLFADPASDQWGTAVMPSNIVDEVKAKLREREAPVNIIYNHFGYWHSVYIIGYDDSAPTNDCKFVTSFDNYMGGQVKEMRAQAEKEADPAKKQKLIDRAAKFEKAGTRFHTAYTSGGGCAPKGMFYVRDSIYADDNAPYVYTPGNPAGNGSYSKAIVLHEYAWLRYMSNHATQIYVKR